MAPSPRSVPRLDPEIARAAILFSFFRAGMTSIEIAHAAADPEAVPSPITADEVLATWRAVGSFAPAWITFGRSLRSAASSRLLSATELAYVFDAGAHFQTEALDQTVFTPPRVPSRGQLEDVNQRLIAARIVTSWIVRRNVARIAESRLTGERLR